MNIEFKNKVDSLLGKYGIYKVSHYAGDAYFVYLNFNNENNPHYSVFMIELTEEEELIFTDAGSNYFFDHYLYSDFDNPDKYKLSKDKVKAIDNINKKFGVKWDKKSNLYIGFKKNISDFDLACKEYIECLKKIYYIIFPNGLNERNLIISSGELLNSITGKYGGCASEEMMNERNTAIINYFGSIDNFKVLMKANFGVGDDYTNLNKIINQVFDKISYNIFTDSYEEKIKYIYKCLHKKSEDKYKIVDKEKQSSNKNIVNDIQEATYDEKLINYLMQKKGVTMIEMAFYIIQGLILLIIAFNYNITLDDGGKIVFALSMCLWVPLYLLILFIGVQLSLGIAKYSIANIVKNGIYNVEKGISRSKKGVSISIRYYLVAIIVTIIYYSLLYYNFENAIFYGVVILVFIMIFKWLTIPFSIIVKNG